MTGNDARSIEGRWHNQLGSCMVLRANGDRNIVGTMVTSVGGASGEQPLVGFMEHTDRARGVIGFVVLWPASASVTAWSGHYDLDAGVIVANWLLTQGEFGQNQWQATRVGHDVFRRDSEVPERSAELEGSAASSFSHRVL